MSTNVIYRTTLGSTPQRGAPQDVQVGDVLGFYVGDAVLTRRVASLTAKGVKTHPLTARGKVIAEAHFVTFDGFYEVLREGEGQSQEEAPPPPPTPSQPRSVPLSVPGARDPRLPPVGTVLCREHKGAEIRVTVQHDGFLLQSNGMVYRSLSKAAQEATGAKAMNGFAFFRLTEALESTPPPMPVAQVTEEPTTPDEAPQTVQTAEDFLLGD